jgi:hypothetical protein
MPTPKKGERKKKFIKRCIPYMHKEEPDTLTSKDKKGKQAYAICNSIYDRSKKKKKTNESVDVYTEDILGDVMGFLNLKQQPLLDEAISLLEEFMKENPNNKRAQELLHELKAIQEYNRKDEVENYGEFYEGVKTFSNYLKENTTSELLDDEYDWEEENFENLYNKFTGWLYEKGFDFYDGEEDFREEFDNIVDDTSIDKEEKAFQITRFLEDKWGLYDGWNETYEKLLELL